MPMVNTYNSYIIKMKPVGGELYIIQSAKHSNIEHTEQRAKNYSQTQFILSLKFVCPTNSFDCVDERL